MLTNKTNRPSLNLLTSPKNNDETKTGIHKLAWQNWLITKPFDWIASPIYLCCCISLLYYREQPGVSKPQILWWQAVVVLVATLCLLFLDRYEYWFVGEDISPRTALGFLLGRVALIQLITMVNPNEITFFLYLIIPFSALLYFGYRIGIGTAIGVCVIFASRTLIFPNPDFVIFRPILFFGLFVLSTIFVMTTATALLHEKTSRAKAEQLLLELKQSQRQLEELAATRERNRLARDIHDSLGHYLTVINIQMGKAKAFREKNPAASEQALEDAKRLANEALQDVRESVKSLRTSQELFSLQKSLPLLIANLQSEKLTIDFEVSGSEATFSKQSLMVLYRVAQEGLTNVQRHSSSSWARVALKFTPKQVELIIEDKGKGFDVQGLADNPHVGYGLCGLQERLEMVGGEFNLDSQPGAGTRLTAIIANDKGDV